MGNKPSIRQTLGRGTEKQSKEREDKLEESAQVRKLFDIVINYNLESIQKDLSIIIERSF
jgi:hypothetical protein